MIGVLCAAYAMAKSYGTPMRAYRQAGRWHVCGLLPEHALCDAYWLVGPDGNVVYINCLEG